MKRIVCVLMVLGVTGCGPTQAQREAGYVQRAPGECVTLGIGPGNPLLPGCIQMEVGLMRKNDEDADNAREAALLGALSTGASSYGASMSAAPTYVYRPPVQTHCFMMGPTMNCTSY